MLNRYIKRDKNVVLHYARALEKSEDLDTVVLHARNLFKAVHKLEARVIFAAGRAASKPRHK